MRLEDTPAGVRILIHNPLWQRYGITPEAAGRMFLDALAQGATILAARVGGQMVGFVWYVTHGAWDRSGCIFPIGMLPPYLGKGVGEKLLAAAEAQMAEEVGEFFLLVTDSNSGARRFYRRLGYYLVGAIPDYVVAGITELIFFKKRLEGKGL